MRPIFYVTRAGTMCFLKLEDVLSLGTLGRFVPWDICPWDLMSVGRFVPCDVCLRTFCLRTINGNILNERADQAKKAYSLLKIRQK